MQSLFTDAPTSECILVTDSEALTRTAIRYAVDTDAALTLLVSQEVTRQLKSEPLTASRLHQLLEKEPAGVYHIEADSIDTVAIFPSELRVPTPIDSETTDVPALCFTDAETVRGVRSAYQSEIASRESVYFRDLPTPWQELVDAIESTFGDAFLKRLQTASEAAPIVGTREDPAAFSDLYVLTSAYEGRTQKEISKFAKTHRLVAPSTITNTAASLEEAGAIARETTSTDRPRRPPKRFKLLDTSLDPRDYPTVTE